jgi:hypothetical protein
MGGVKEGATDGMTKEEAIRIVSRFRDVWDDSTTPSAEALDMAIKALEQEPVYFPPCVDCNTKMNEIREAYDNLKKQEPCEDAVTPRKGWTSVVFNRFS